MKHFRFEFKNLILTKKFLIALALLIAAVSLLFYRNILFQDYAKEQEMKELDTYIKYHRDKDYSYDRHLAETPGDKEVQVKQELNDEVLQSALIWSSTRSRDEDWQLTVQSEINFLEQVIGYLDMGEEHLLDHEEIMYRITLNNEFLDRNIPPEYENYSIALPNFTKQIIDLFVMYGSFFIVLLLISELLSYEFESRSILFQFTQPLNRANIIISKFFSAIALYIIVTIIMLLTSVTATSIFGTKGYFDYPILAEFDGVLQSIPIADYLIYALIANAVIIIFMIALYLLYSVLTQHTLLSLFLTAITIVFGHFLTTFINWDPVAWISPFRPALSMEFVTLQNNQTWFQSIPITLILTIVILIMAILKIRTAKVE